MSSTVREFVLEEFAASDRPRHGAKASIPLAEGSDGQPKWDGFSLTKIQRGENFMDRGWTGGRPILPSADIVLVIAIKIATGYSARGLKPIVKDLLKRGFITSTPSHSTINRYAVLPEVQSLALSLLDSKADKLKYLNELARLTSYSRDKRVLDDDIAKLKQLIFSDFKKLTHSHLLRKPKGVCYSLKGMYNGKGWKKAKAVPSQTEYEMPLT